MEVQEQIEGLSDEDFAKFQADFGGDRLSRKEYIDAFVNNPAAQERKLCQLLGLLTESEKLTQSILESDHASRTSAAAAVESARQARIAVHISEVAVIVSIVGALISVMALAVLAIKH
jgi:hypothetical protein